MHHEVRSAIIGAGMIGAVHARAVTAAGGRVVGVVASSPSRSAEVAAAWGLSRSYADLDAVLEDKSVDLVHICTPNGLHVEQVAAALRAGKHVICEKPLATSADDAAFLVELAQAQRRVLAVPFVYRYHPLVREIRARREAGELGSVHLIHGSYLQDWLLQADSTNWRVDASTGGASRAFADIGSHWCDLVEWVGGVRFTAVSALFSSPIEGRPQAPQDADAVTEDAAVALFRTSDGVLANLTVSQVSPGRKNRLWFEIDGDEASAVFDQEQPETVWLGGQDFSRIIVRDNTRGSQPERALSVLPAGHPQGYNECFAAFIGDVHQAMAGDIPEGLPTGRDGLRSALLVDATLRSAQSEAWQHVPAEYIPRPHAVNA